MESVKILYTVDGAADQYNHDGKWFRDAEKVKNRQLH